MRKTRGDIARIQTKRKMKTTEPFTIFVASDGLSASLAASSWHAIDPRNVLYSNNKTTRATASDVALDPMVELDWNNAEHVVGDMFDVWLTLGSFGGCQGGRRRRFCQENLQGTRILEKNKLVDAMR
jgi:hypothetical protein